MAHPPPSHHYSPLYTLRERVLNPLNAIRGQLAIAIALCQHIEPVYGDAPLGIDSHGDLDAIFVSGVFSRTAMMVVLSDCMHLVPKGFRIYRLASKRDEPTGDAKFFCPRTAYETDTELVGVTIVASQALKPGTSKLRRERPFASMVSARQLQTFLMSQTRCRRTPLPCIRSNNVRRCGDSPRIPSRRSSRIRPSSP